MSSARFGSRHVAAIVFGAMAATIACSASGQQPTCDCPPANPVTEGYVVVEGGRV
jgi:hypothetical protein